MQASDNCCRCGMGRRLCTGRLMYSEEGSRERGPRELTHLPARSQACMRQQGSPSRGTRPGAMATRTQSPLGASSVKVGGSSASIRLSSWAAEEGVMAAAAPASASSSPGCSLRKACDEGEALGARADE